MTKSLAVVSRTPSWHLTDLTRAATARGWTVRRMDIELLSASLYRPSRSTILPHGPVNSTASHLDDAVLVRAFPSGSLEQVIFRMDALAEWERLGVRIINPPKTFEWCVDKYLALCHLQRAGLPVPNTIVCQTAEQARQALGELGGIAVYKPLFGSEGRGLQLIGTRADSIHRLAELESAGAVIYLQEYIEHGGWDLRLFVVGERVWGMRRENAADWRLNAARGAATRPHAPNPMETAIALSAAVALGATIAGVDVLYDRQGAPYVLEVNGAPGWKHLAQTLAVDIASEVIQWVESSLNGSAEWPHAARSDETGNLADPLGRAKTSS